MIRVALKKGVPLADLFALSGVEPITRALPELRVLNIISHREFLRDVNTEFINRYKSND